MNYKIGIYKEVNGNVVNELKCEAERESVPKPYSHADLMVFGINETYEINDTTAITVKGDAEALGLVDWNDEALGLIAKFAAYFKFDGKLYKFTYTFDNLRCAKLLCWDNENTDVTDLEEETADHEYSNWYGYKGEPLD